MKLPTGCLGAAVSALQTHTEPLHIHTTLGQAAAHGGFPIGAKSSVPAAQQQLSNIAHERRLQPVEPGAQVAATIAVHAN
jgi:hypothetical protein